MSNIVNIIGLPKLDPASHYLNTKEEVVNAKRNIILSFKQVGRAE